MIRTVPPLPSCWAIRPDVLLQMEKRLADADLVSALALYDAPREERQPAKPYNVVNGQAVIPISGPLQKEGDFWSWFFGMSSTQEISGWLLQAVTDETVTGILLQIDSPGGTVDGTDALADLVRQVDAVKPVTSFADGQMCSAAYWIGSQASLVLAEPTAEIGSIGTLMTLANYTDALKNEGVTVTHLATGTLKTAGSPYKPLSESDTQYLTGLLNDFQSHFSSAVSTARGLSASAMSAIEAEARVWVASQAGDKGLIDGMTRRADLYAQFAEHGSTWDAGLSRRTRTPQGVSSMNLIDWARGLTAAAPEPEPQASAPAVPAPDALAQLTAERDTLAGQVTALATEREALSAENTRLASENNRLVIATYAALGKITPDNVNNEAAVRLANPAAYDAAMANRSVVAALNFAPLAGGVPADSLVVTLASTTNAGGGDANLTAQVTGLAESMLTNFTGGSNAAKN